MPKGEAVKRKGENEGRNPLLSYPQASYWHLFVYGL